MKFREQQGPAYSRSETGAIAGMIVAGLTSAVGFVQAGLSQAGEQAIATTILSVLIVVSVGLSPVLLAVWALWRRRKWGPIIVTFAGLWASILSVSWGPLISLVVLGTSIVAIVFAWIHSVGSAGRSENQGAPTTPEADGDGSM